jgi:hypothetical protein
MANRDCAARDTGERGRWRRPIALRWASVLVIALMLASTDAVAGDEGGEVGLRLGGGDNMRTRAVYTRWPAEFVQERIAEPYLVEGIEAFWDLTIEHWVRSSYGLDMVAFGPVFAVPLNPESLALSLGLQPSFVVGESRYSRDLGGSVQFTSHAGLRWEPKPRLTLGLRIQHTSNGGIAAPNPGVDGIKLALGYRF